MARERSGGRVGGLPAVWMYLVGAAVVVLASVTLGAWEVKAAEQRAEDRAEDRALEVARTAAAAINVGMETATYQLDNVVRNTGIAALTVDDPGAQSACEQKLAAVVVQGFSFLLRDGQGRIVCTVRADKGQDSTMAAGADSVMRWLDTGTGFEQLGMAGLPLVPGRMTFSPDGQTGVAAVAVRAGDNVAVGWLDTWAAFNPPLDTALVAPGIDAAVVIDDTGRVVVPVPDLIDGRTVSSNARPFDDGTALVGPQGSSKAYAQLEGLRAGESSGVQASSVPTGGRARGAEGTKWVSVPVPRLDGSVAVAWDPRSAGAETRAARSGVLVALGVLAAVAVAVLGMLWAAASRPVGRLVRQVRAAGGGPLSGNAGGAREVRELRDAFDGYSQNWRHVAEVAAASRERERERLTNLVNAEVAQRLATGSLLVAEDPAAARAQLAAAGTRLGEILSPEGDRVGEGLAAALGSYASGEGAWLVFEDRGGVRADRYVERIMYQAVLEVLAAAQAQGCTAQVVVDADDGRAQVAVTVTGGGTCAGVDDPDYWAGSELAAVGGEVLRSVGADGSRQVLFLARR